MVKVHILALIELDMDEKEARSKVRINALKRKIANEIKRTAGFNVIDTTVKRKRNGRGG